jgi:hypothetical protein
MDAFSSATAAWTSSRTSEGFSPFRISTIPSTPPSRRSFAKIPEGTAEAVATSAMSRT